MKGGEITILINTLLEQENENNRRSIYLERVAPRAPISPIDLFDDEYFEAT